MSLIDVILNAACLLLWLNWRSIRVVPPAHSQPLTLLSTLKRTEPRPVARQLYLAGLAALVLIRSLFYWDIGATVGWVPLMKIGPLALPFRSDHPWRMALFSFLSFGCWLWTFYAWLLLVSVINRKEPDHNSIQKLIRLHLGWVERLPGVLKLLLPAAVVIGAWGASRPSLAEMGVLPPAQSAAHVWQEAALLGLSSVLVWRFLLAALLLIYFIHSYVYLGERQWLEFTSNTARNLLQPLRWIPHQFGRLDALPLLGLMALFGLDWLAAFGLPRLYQMLPL